MMHTFWPGILTAALLLTGVGAIPASAALTIFGNAPRVELQGPGNSFELGTVFQSSQAGQVTGLRFYMGPIEASNPGGAIIGKLWTDSGTLLASVVFPNPTEGWNEVDLSAAVSISASTSYVVSANNNLTTQGTNYSTNEFAFFGGGPFTSGPLTATKGTAASPAGTFPTGIFPNQGGGSFYGRDVIFEPEQTAAVPEPASLGLWAFAAAAVLGSRYRRRTHRPRVKCPSERRVVATHLRLERLEDRLAMSGFGPEDGSYIVESWEGSYSDIAIQPGTQAMVAVGGIAGQTPSTMALRRYDFDGNVDLSYGTGGIASVGPGGASALALAFQPDGKALIAGQQTLASGYDVGVGRLTAAGQPDTGFSGDGWATVSTVSGSSSEYASSIAIQSDGDVIVGGNSSLVRTLVASFKPTGALDSGKNAFGQIVQGKAAGYHVNSFGAVLARFDGGITIQPDNKIVAAGKLSTDGLNWKTLVARYTSDGKLDTTFAGKGYTALLSPQGFSNSQAHGIILQSDGKIVVAGNADGMDGAGDVFVARYNANGTHDTTFAGKGYTRLDIDGATTVTNETAYSLSIQPDGKIVILGREFLQSETTTKNVLVARFNSDGTLDAGFGDGGFKIGAAPAGHTFYTEGLLIQPDGDIVAAGYYFEGSTTRPLLMRFYGESSMLASTTTESAAAVDEAIMLLMNDTFGTPTKRK